MGVWGYDRYVRHASYAYISWATIKDNFRQGFGYDSDPFFTNFFMHPYHGTLYFNTARSLGMNTLESSFYALGGSLMWEMFLENQRPSVNDVIMTTLGGTFGGEILFRMSSLVLDDTATGPVRVLREAVVLVLNPWRGVNRLIFGDAWRVSDTDTQIREPVSGYIASAVNFVALNDDLSPTRAGPGFEFEFTYGETYGDRNSRRPFDFIVFNGGLRFSGGPGLFNVDSYALLWGRSHEHKNGVKHLLGFFQDYDYLRNEEMEMGGVSLTGGTIREFPLGANWRLMTSLQAGAMVFGASNNPFLDTQPRNYNYGLGPLIKAEVRLMHATLGALGVRFNHYEIYTIDVSAFEADESHDHLSIFKAQYRLPIWRKLGVGAEYALYYRHMHFTGHPRVNQSLSRLSFGAFAGF